MEKHLIVGMLAILLLSCGGGARRDTEKTVSAEDSVVWGDSMLVDITDEPVVHNIDGSFEDFIIQYSYDPELQKERTKFPLPYTASGKDTTLTWADWEKNPLLADVEIYSTIYEREADMEAEKDTALSRVVVEVFALEADAVSEYTFVREAGKWQLARVDEKALKASPDHDFVKFYERFVGDSLYQSRHVQNPLVFLTTDPEDDFSVIEATIDVEQWFAFALPLPGKELVHLDYGVKMHRRGQRVLTVKNVVEGTCCTLFFKRMADGWMLDKYEDVSN